MTRLRALVALLAVVAGAAPASDADASRFTVPPIENGPVFAGSGVAWAQPTKGRGTAFVRATTRGEGRTLLLRRDPQETLSSFGLILGSPRGIVAEFFTYDRYPRETGSYGFDLYTGAASSRSLSRRVKRCLTDDGSYAGVNSVDLRGDELVHRACDYGDGAVVTDLGAGTRHEIPARGDDIQVAGRYAAWAERTDDHESVVVYDMDAGQIVYTVPATSASDGISVMDLDDDGTLVAVAWDNTVWWASPSAPERHLIPVGRRDVYHVQLVDRRIGFLRGRGWNGVTSRGEVGVADLAGHTQVLGRGAMGTSFGRSFGFDGRRVVWAAASCGGARIHVQALGSRPAKESMRRCPLRFDEIDVHKRRKVEIEPDCHGYAGGCDLHHLRMTRRVNGRRVLVLSGQFARFRLTREGERLLRERGPLRVRATATIMDYAGTSERRHGMAVIPLP